MNPFGNLTVAVSNATLDPTYYGSVWDSTNSRLFIVYYDQDLSGTYVKIARKSAGTLLYGAAQLVVAGSINNRSILFDSVSGKVVFAGQDNLNSQCACWVMQANPGAETVTVGSPVNWRNPGDNAGNTLLRYDTANSKVILRDSLLFFIGTVSGNSISFGPVNTLVPSTSLIETAAMEYDPVSGKIIFVQPDNSYSDTVYYVGTISGTTITWGSEQTLVNEHWYALKSEWNPVDGKIAFYPQPDYGSTVIRQASFSGTTLTLDAVVNIDYGLSASIVTLGHHPSTNKFLVPGGSTPTVFVAIEAGVTSDVLTIYGNEPSAIKYACSSDGNDAFFYESADAANEMRFSIMDASIDIENPCKDVVFGNPQVAATTNGGQGKSRRVASVGGGKFVILYRDGTNSYWTVQAGQTDSNGGITWGTPVLVAGSNSWQSINISKAAFGKACIFGKNNTLSGEDSAHLLTLSGLTISVGAQSQPVNAVIDQRTSLAFDEDSGKIVAVYSLSNVTYSVTGVPSGTTIAWGTPVNNGVIGNNDQILSSIGGGKFTYIYQSTGPKIRIGIISGSGLSFGSAVACDDVSSTSGTSSGDTVVDPVTGNIVVPFYANEYPQNSVERIRLGSVSGNTITWLSGASMLYAASIQGTPWIAFDPYSKALISAFQTDDVYDRLRVSAAYITGNAIDNCPAKTEIFNPSPDNWAAYTYGVATDDENDFAVVIYEEQGDIGAFTVRGEVPIVLACDIKPKQTVILQEGTPGAPGFVGQPYVPGYTIFDTDCVTQASTIESDGAGGYIERNCETQGALTICWTIYIPGEAPFDAGDTYDPFNLGGNDSGFGTSSGSKIISQDICAAPIYVSAQNYIPPSPPQPPTPTEYAIDYDLGWNYDVLLGSGSNLTIVIDKDTVKNSTSGVAIGMSNLGDWPLNGVGKFPIWLLFEADQVSVFHGVTRVWGQTTRSLTDLFYLKQYGSQVAAFRNDTEIYKADVLNGGPVAVGGIIYKAGDAICPPEPTSPPIISSTAYAISTGTGDVTLPVIETQAYEDAYGVGDVTLPPLSLDAGAGNHGAADIDLPAFFVNSSEGYGGFALVSLPGISAAGYEASTLNGYADITLPAVAATGSDASGYAYGSTSLPVVQVDGSGNFALPVAQGADITIPHILQGATGLTGEVGGLDTDLPTWDVVGADRAIYGEVDTVLPVLTLFAGDLPVYDGVLSGWFAPMEGELYGHELPINGFDGNISTGLEGELYGGATLDAELPGLEAVTLTGTVTSVIRLDATFPGLQFVGSSLTGAYGDLQGDLGLPMDGWMFGGGQLDGALPSLAGNLSGTVGTVGRLYGDLPALAGSLTGTISGLGRLIGDLPALEARWGILDGTFPALTGSAQETALAIADYVAWVMNKKTQAVSRYPDYPFSFVCRRADSNYVVSSGGIYRIGGEYDVDQPIEAGFTLPSSDMGVSSEKISPRLYLQGDVQGQFAVTTMADDQDPVRSVSIIHPGVGYHRCKLPRGIRGTHLGFDVDNVSGADFEIEQVDVLVADSGRKV